MHAFLITGNTKDARKLEIEKKQTAGHVSAFDVISILREEGTIGIDQIREFQHSLMFTPYHSKQKMGVIHDAETLTTEAQNALLKTLEEPPARTILFLETENPDVLLPTILSRCQIVHIKGDSNAQAIDSMLLCFKTIEHAMAQSIGKRIQFVDEITKTRDEAKAWVETAIHAVRHAMLQNLSMNSARLLRRLLTARSQLGVNVNPKLVLDAVVLS
ncbi:MAG: hypothetical protein AAB457_03270 [Patescibacteria group bacterium]